MNLIAYSDSEDSGDDAPAVPKIAPKPAPKPAPKLAFQKVVDRSNPGKIKLNLPGVTRPQAIKDDLEDDAPPAKKARTGGGAFGGFNSMLPAPKKPQLDAAAKRGGKGLGSGVNLRTGAEPAFEREPRLSEIEEYDENGNLVKKEPMSKDDFRAMLNLPAPKSGSLEKPSPAQKEEVIKEAQPEVKPATAPKPRFMPLSVARGKKKKPIVARPAATLTDTQSSTTTTPQTGPSETKPPPKPKISLFSMTQETHVPTNPHPVDDYQPLLHNASTSSDPPPSASYPEPTSSAAPAPSTPAPSGLTNIASELNLSAAEQRQLFGRKGASHTNVASFNNAKFVEFNTDAEYAHNEQLRAQGETVQHNALKSISGTGKNSLRSLVNVAVGQKDALEEHFARGKTNKREAGSKYGW